ncbi:hypothetical protein [Methanobrevibacter sp.]|nr:hypothetical protein [Methanobrevibacter sp.]MEE0939500.1 hypothetical protein [Methanobrevibacter sp.]
MAKGIEFLLGGAICLIIAIIHSVMEKKIFPGRYPSNWTVHLWSV